MGKVNIITSLRQTTVCNDSTRIRLGKIIERGFYSPDSTPEKKEEYLAIAYQFQVPQFDNMLNSI